MRGNLEPDCFTNYGIDAAAVIDGVKAKRATIAGLDVASHSVKAFYAP